MPTPFDEAIRYLPDGLSERGLAQLYEQLSRLDQNFPFYSEIPFDFILQGDLLAGVNHYAFSPDGSVQQATARVMLLSNTCDMSSDNVRHDDVMVSVAPVMKVSRWVDLQRSRGIQESQIEHRANAAKRQRLTSIVYLPAAGDLEESFVLLDKIQSIPIALLPNWQHARYAVLSQAGQWTLVTKLSIHFSRQLEGVARG